MRVKSKAFQEHYNQEQEEKENTVDNVLLGVLDTLMNQPSAMLERRILFLRKINKGTIAWLEGKGYEVREFIKENYDISW